MVMLSTIFVASFLIFTASCGLAGQALSPSNSLDYQVHEFEGPVNAGIALYSNSSSTVKCEHPWNNHSVVVHGNISFITSCQFVLDYCSSVAALADYLRFIVCYSSYKWLIYLVLALWLLYLISLLATTADYFFVPPLNLLAQKLRLSPSVAGITLLAIGNGAPDVFTAYAALDKADDLSLELSALLGASIFILTVVLGSVILVAEVSSSTIRRTDFVRDLSAYVVVVGIVIAISLDGKIHVYESVAFLAAYIAYIALVVGLGYIKRCRRSEEYTRLKQDSTIAAYNFSGLPIPK
jgi:hypothetical protein